MVVSRLLFSVLLLFPTLAYSASEKEPVPTRVLRYKGKDVPLYDIKDVTPWHTVKPAYPGAMRKNGINGVAVILTLVSSDGRVAEVATKSSAPDPAFGEAARECVREWKFPRVKRGGAHTDFLVQVTIEFSISDE